MGQTGLPGSAGLSSLGSGKLLRGRLGPLRAFRTFNYAGWKQRRRHNDWGGRRGRGGQVGSRLRLRGDNGQGRGGSSPYGSRGYVRHLTHVRFTGNLDDLFRERGGRRTNESLSSTNVIIGGSPLIGRSRKR